MGKGEEKEKRGEGRRRKRRGRKEGMEGGRKEGREGRRKDKRISGLLNVYSFVVETYFSSTNQLGQG